MASTTSSGGSQRKLLRETNPVLITTAVLLTLAWLAVSLRVCVRTFVINAFGWDDFVLLVTTLLYSGMCAFLFLTYAVAATAVDGRFRPKDAVSLQIYTIATMLLYLATTIAFKIALGLFYLRIVVKSWQRNTVLVVLTVSTIYGVAYIFFTLFQCGNPSKYLEHSQERKCVPWPITLSIVIVGGLINTFSEWIFALLLISALRETQMPSPAKISAGCLLLMGTAGSICSVIRLFYVDELDPKPHGNHVGTQFTLWSIAECGICITAAALAATRPLFRRCLEHARSYTPTMSSRRNVTSKTGTRRDREGAHQLPDRVSHDWTTKPSSEFELWGYGGNSTTVVGNSRVMEKRGLADTMERHTNADGFETWSVDHGE